MSLIKQLWIGIIFMLLLALGGSFFISLMSAKHYLEEQLLIKNMDNATSLALSMTQMEKDPVTFELLISAQFDTGHYEYITLTDPNNAIQIARHYDENANETNDLGAPLWFTKLISLDAPAGIAKVQNGWQQYGTLTIKSHSRYAWKALWNSTLQLLYWFVIAAFLCGLFGSLVLQYISSPLDIVIKQAEAISERRFITTDEPRTIEFQRLVRAMNSLSRGVKAMLEKETKQLDKLRRESQIDALSDLSNRSHFLNLLESKLAQSDSESNGVAALVRVLNLSDLNHQLGRAAADHILLQISGVIHQIMTRYENAYAGRLNGSDFMLVIPGNTSAESIGMELSEQLNSQLAESDLTNVQLPISVCTFMAGETRPELLSKLDGALSQAELKGNRALITISSTDYHLSRRNLTEWRDAISRALDEQQLKLGEFPVKKTTGEILQYEAPVRLKIDGDWQQAGYFMPWAARLGILPNIDLQVIKTALNDLNDSLRDIAINISEHSLCNAAFREQALALLNEDKTKAWHLWLEFPEPCALRHVAELRAFALSLRTLGCQVGLEHVGLEFTKIRELQDIGLQYLKIDSAIIRDIDSNPGNQQFLHGLCKIGHSLGMLMIAEGVQTDAEKDKIIRLGIDGYTGPGA